MRSIWRRDLFGGVAYEHIVDVARLVAADIVSVIFDPMHVAVLVDNAVFDVIEIVLVVLYLFGYAVFYLVEVVRMNHAAKGVLRERGNSSSVSHL